jgi:hypothetical protein
MDTHIAILFLAGLAVSILCSAFFSGAETALLSGESTCSGCAAKGGRRAGLVRSLKAHSPRLLATTLIGQNLFNSAASAPTPRPGHGVARRPLWPAGRHPFSTSLFAFAEMRPATGGGACRGLASRRRAADRARAPGLATDFFVGATTRALASSACGAAAGPDRGRAQASSTSAPTRASSMASAAIPQGRRVRRQDRARHHGAHTKIVACRDRVVSRRPPRPHGAQARGFHLPRQPTASSAFSGPRISSTSPTRRRQFELPIASILPCSSRSSPADDVFREMRRRRTHGDRRGRVRRHCRPRDRGRHRRAPGPIGTSTTRRRGYAPAAGRAVLDGTLRLDDLKSASARPSPRRSDTIAGT